MENETQHNEFDLESLLGREECVKHEKPTDLTQSIFGNAVIN